jgi:hypothetical protein
MEQNNNQIETNESKCCIDYCNQVIESDSQQVTNSYKCGQAKFSTSELWNIEKRRRQFSRRSTIFTIN